MSIKENEFMVKDNTIIVSGDFGNADSKLAVQLADGTLHTTVTQSVVLESKHIKSEFSFGDEELDHISLEIGGNSYVIGDDVGKNLKALPTNAVTNRYNMESFKVLLAGSLYKLLGDKIDKYDILFCTGVPNKEVNSINKKQFELYERTLQNLKQVVVNGKQYNINIKKFTIHSQATSALYNEVFDEKFNPNLELLNEKNLMVDIGGGTTDVAVLDNKNIIDSSINSLDVGVNDVLNECANYISAIAEEHVPKNLVSKYFDTCGFVVNKRLTVDFTDVKEQSSSELALRIKNELTSRYGNLNHYDNIIFSGGGSKALEKHIKDIFGSDGYKNVVISKDGRFAIVLGQLKRGIITNS